MKFSSLTTEKMPGERKSRRFHLGVAARSMLFLGATRAFGQPVPRAAVAPVTAAGLPVHLRRYVHPLAARITVAGKERGTHAGTLDVGGAREAISWTAEFPGKLRVLRGSAGRSLIFDLQGVGQVLDDLDADLLESLSADTADSFLDTVRRGYQPRMLGSRFRVPGVTGFGAEMDIFEMALPVTARREAGTAVKHFAFDTPTGLLREVTYHRIVGSASTRQITRYSNYETVDGTPIPKQIERFQGAQRRFQINVATSLLQAAAVDGLFNTGR